MADAQASRVVATRGDGQQLLVVDHDDPRGDARIYDTHTKKLSQVMPFQAILKQGYWQECKPQSLKEMLGDQAEPDLHKSVRQPQTAMERLFSRRRSEESDAPTQE